MPRQQSVLHGYRSWFNLDMNTLHGTAIDLHHQEDIVVNILFWYEAAAVTFELQVILLHVCLTIINSDEFWTNALTPCYESLGMFEATKVGRNVVLYVFFFNPSYTDVAIQHIPNFRFGH